jgi:hypothetical protein
MENPDSLRLLVARLPYEIRRRWRSIADKITEEENREVCFRDIVIFIEKEARIVNHPVFGDISGSVLPQNTYVAKPTIKPRGISFVTNANDNSYFARNIITDSHSYDRPSIQGDNYYKKCIMCSNNHDIVNCTEFQSKSYADRSTFALNHGLCYNCLIPHHRVKDCRKPPMCKQCGKKHSNLLHLSNDDTTVTAETQKAKLNLSENCPEIKNAYIDRNDTTSDMNSFTSSTIGLPIVPVKVKAKDSDVVITTYALLDPGSNSTFCSDALINNLNIQGKRVSYSLTTLQEENFTTNSLVVSLDIFDMEENTCIDLPCVFSRPSLSVSTKDIPRQDDVDRWAHLNGIQVPQVDADVGLLIGNNHVDALEPFEIRNSQDKGPYAVRTALGWAINGPLGRHTSERRSSNFITADLDEQFREYCNREFSDSLVDTNKMMSQDDMRAVQMMDDSVHFTDGHYELGLPFKNALPLPNNRSMTDHRRHLLKRRLLNDPELCKKYANFMTELLVKGYAEEVPKSQLDRSDGRVWYLPHHSVNHTKKPDKVRIVFDCAAKYRGTSLNDNLLQGPDLTNNLVGVLIRFRQEPIALVADIEAMFHQVRVPKEHRDVLRFLWWPSGLESKPTEYRMTVHLFGATSSPSCCNYALKKTADDHAVECCTDTVATVHNNFSVDDCLKSVSNECCAIQQVQELSDLLHEGGFHLTKWMSNSERVMATIPHKERAATIKDLDFSTLMIERALGVQWDLVSDSFRFHVIIKDKPFTRRGILSIMSSVYDPLGFLAPVILPVKKMLQEFCRLRLAWDDPVPEQYANIWQRWLNDLKKLTAFSVPRCLKPMYSSDESSFELHHFGDASENGYGVVTYLRVSSPNGQVHCSFIMGKSRVAPLKQISIPRMELSAGALSVRQDKMIRQELEIPITRSIYWTDSTSVLKFIRNNDKRFHTFVANRIGIIRDGSDVNDWRYVDTDQNPADEASRGLCAHEMVEGCRWSTGPGFLWRHEDDWPKQPDDFAQIQDDHPEVKLAKSCHSTITSSPEHDVIERLLVRFSSWYKVKKFFAWILRYKSNLLIAARDRSIGNPWKYDQQRTSVAPITVDEMDAAEHEILRHVQKPYHSNKSSIRKLDPVIIDGLLRVGGRLNHSSLDVDAKHQVILPKNHVISRLIINHVHSISGHSGREYVLALLRKKYWITHGNSAVRTVLSRCIDCKKKHGRVEQQKMANLPEDRLVADKPPFSFVGTDFFGAFLVKRGRAQVKRYGLIFTCMTTRTVPFEVTHGLDTDSFLCGISRFIARRGKPELIRSDNGGSFVRGEKEIREGIGKWNQNAIHEHLLQKNIKWIFNPPLGSHHGGIWERCIRSARRILNSLLQQQTVDDECLSTLMCEVENIMNGRPITRVSDDHTDFEALTPNHLLLFRDVSSMPLGTFNKDDMFHRRRWRQMQYMADLFWKRWLHEYLPLLQKRQKWNTPKDNLKIGDIVLLVDNTVSRNCWPLGRVVCVLPNRDGLVRRVRVKSKSSELERPIDKLILLDSVHNIESN